MVNNHMKIMPFAKLDCQGFTLFEIMLVMTIIAMVSAFGVGIISSLQGMASTTGTINRMSVIEKKARDYYRGHGAMPTPSSAPADSVPTEQSLLDLEQKFRLDAWGRYIEYHVNGTDITGVTVDTTSVAGVLISGGPNKVIDTDTTTTAFTTTGDDILVGINVSAQAVAMAIEELITLQEKVNAYDKVYQGVDNDDDGTMDETGCSAVTVSSGCPLSPGTALTTNDPSCGSATLDAWDSYACASPYDNVLDFIVSWYGLGDEYMTDPWDNSYDWGDATTYASSDAQYHKFFSPGPDGTSGTDDDIIP